MGQIPSREAFTGHMGDSFRLPLNADQSLSLTLIEVTPLKAYEGLPRQDPMALLFRGPCDVVLPQNTYNLEHERLGTVTLFLVPIIPDAEGPRYEAVIN